MVRLSDEETVLRTDPFFRLKIELKMLVISLFSIGLDLGPGMGFYCIGPYSFEPRKKKNQKSLPFFSRDAFMAIFFTGVVLLRLSDVRE